MKSETRYKNAKPVKHAFCSAAYHTKMRLISMDDYKKRFGVGIQIAHSTSSPSAVEDENGKLLYLKANGVKVSFLNAELGSLLLQKKCRYLIIASNTHEGLF